MLLEGSAAAWTLAFVAFVALYGRALMKPKADRRQDAN
jgi:uncharacterized protein involved in response to NO